MDPVIAVIIGVIVVTVLGMWYYYEEIDYGNATVYLQGTLDNAQLDIELPEHLSLQRGDRVMVLEVPDLTSSQRNEPVRYQSRVCLHKASWFHRLLTKEAGTIELSEHAVSKAR